MVKGSLTIQDRAVGIHVVGQRAYLPTSVGTLKVVDVSDPADPVLLGTSDALGTMEKVEVVGNLAYVAGLSGLFILDVSDPRDPEMIGLFDTAGIGNGYGVDVVGDLAYLADGLGGLQIVDVSNPTSPTLRGSLTSAIYALNVRVVGNLAYVAGRGLGVHIVDVTNPAAPSLHSSFATRDLPTISK